MKILKIEICLTITNNRRPDTKKLTFLTKNNNLCNELTPSAV